MIELSIVVKATAVAALGLVGTHLAGRTRASVRHLLLATTFGALLALPALMLGVPALTYEVRVPNVIPAALQTPAAPPSDSRLPTPDSRLSSPDSRLSTPASSVSWAAIARWTWLAGALLFAVPLAVVGWRLRRVHRTSIPSPDLTTLAQAIATESGMRQAIEVVQHDELAAPITFGFFRSIVVMPMDARTWHPDDVKRAIVHELEHVRRADWAVLVAARSVASIYWFHPLVWMAWRQLGLEAERSCDDAVLNKSESADYAEQLVSLAYKLSAAGATPILGMANRSDLSRRVSSLLDEAQQRGRAGFMTITSTIAVASFVVLAVGPLRAVAAVTPPPAPSVAAARGDNAGEQAKKKSRKSDALGRALFEAAQEGDLAAVNELIDDGADANALIEGDGSPLIGAAQSGVLAIAQKLIDSGADPNMPVPGDGSPLIAAAAHGSLSIVKLLLDRGADVNQIVEGDENALMNAAEQGRLEIVKLLVSRGANVNERIWNPHYSTSGRRSTTEGEWRTAISQAAKNRHMDVVAYLQSVGARE